MVVAPGAWRLEQRTIKRVTRRHFCLDAPFPPGRWPGELGSDPLLHRCLNLSVFTSKALALKDFSSWQREVMTIYKERYDNAYIAMTWAMKMSLR